MSDYVIVVPKQDELLAVEWAFRTRLDRPDERTGSGVDLFRRELPFGAVTFALLDRQTNTYSSLLTADVIGREAPRMIFLVGTATGKARSIPVGSVVVADGVVDISEKRSGDDGRETYVARGPTRSDELTLDARDFIARTFDRERAQRTIRGMARTPTLVRGADRVADFVARHDPRVFCETIVSGNDYRMGPSPEADRMWAQTPTARAYDMEAAGFALAGSINMVPWLVVRGISDHGSPETKSELNRTIAAGLAGRFLAEFLTRGLVRASRPTARTEPARALRQLRDKAYRLDGTWQGAMAYLDDDGNEVVFVEQGEFGQDGSTVQGVIRSARVLGRARHEDLEYRVSFSIARHGYAGGVWSETIAARRYFGVMLGAFDPTNTVLAGTWLGTHRNGVRRGFFKWYNTRRDGRRGEVTLDMDATIAELRASFSLDLLRAYNDACRVAL